MNKRGNVTGVVYRVPLRGGEGLDVKDLRVIAMRESTQEAVRSRKTPREFAQLRGARSSLDISHEDQDLEPRVRWKEVMDVHGLRVRRVNEYMWNHAFADDEFRRGGLQRIVDDY